MKGNLLFRLSALLFFFGRNGVISMSSPGMTLQYSLGAKPESFKRTMNSNSINGILGAGWSVAA